jgi:3-oxoacyl-[acyl-carrier protein] reductase
MVLQGKNAVIYGAGGSLGSAVASALSSAGAKVFITGRNLASVQKCAGEIIAAGGQVDVHQVDAFDEKTINNHIAMTVEKAGKVDVSFNLIGYEVVQNIPLVDMTVADFVHPSSMALQTQFLTATAAARIMIKQGSGIILTLTATPGGIGYPFTGGFGPSCCAIESFTKTLAAEIGVHGVRVVNLRSGGSPDSKTFKEAIDSNPEVMEIVLQKMRADTMLKKLPSMADIANTVVFLSSDLAGKITGVTIDLTCGTTAGLNYRVD